MERSTFTKKDYKKLIKEVSETIKYKQVDSIEELCDAFIVLRDDYTSHPLKPVQFNTLDEALKFILDGNCHECKNIKIIGAIYTREEDLIYIAEKTDCRPFKLIKKGKYL